MSMRVRLGSILAGGGLSPETVKAGEEAIAALNDDLDRSRALWWFAKQLTSERRTEAAEAVAGAVEEASDRVELEVEVAVQWATNGRNERALALLRRAESDVETGDHFSGPPQWAGAIRDVARALAEITQRQAALRLWDKAIAVAQAGEAHPSEQERIDSAKVLWQIVDDLGWAGELGRALVVAQAIRNEAVRGKAIAQVEQAANGPR